MLKRYTIKTERRGLYNITSYVRQAVTESGVQSGIAVVFCPHTTAAITINENADPDVKTDLLYALEETFPNRPQFRHAEGNSDAHMSQAVLALRKLLSSTITNFFWALGRVSISLSLTDREQETFL